MENSVDTFIIKCPTDYFFASHKITGGISGLGNRVYI